MGSFVGALIATYFVSRLLGRFLPQLPAAARLVLVHLISFALLALGIGLLKAYYTSFAAQQTMVFIVPQLIWFGIDILRGKASFQRSRR